MNGHGIFKTTGNETIRLNRRQRNFAAVQVCFQKALGQFFDRRHSNHHPSFCLLAECCHDLALLAKAINAKFDDSPAFRKTVGLLSWPTRGGMPVVTTSPGMSRIEPEH
ncbi:hypothetical protein [Agrobacterium tumefaciens]|uniref:hypothetical protein n=1 Tax=Agrobacterium tumefaciens TaxID=358 RepID=UPI003A5227B0